MTLEKESHQMAIALVHCLSGCLSTIGNALIFASVISIQRKQKLTSFQRLLLGLTIYDLMHSVAVTATTLPVRKDAEVWGSMGNVATCTAQGFFQQQAQAAFWYSSAMALYFLGKIRYSLNDRTIARYENIFHVVTFVILETFAVSAIFVDAYNPMWFSELGCWFGPWPSGCEGDECERGKHYEYFSYFGAIVFQVATFIIITVCNILIFRTFRKQERQMMRYAGGGDLHLSREIAIQGFLYSGAALNTVFWGFLSLLMGTYTNFGEDALLFFSLMNAFMFPIQGFLNFVIYVRPRYNRVKKNHPDAKLGLITLLRVALFRDGKLPGGRKPAKTQVTSVPDNADMEPHEDEQAPHEQIHSQRETSDEIDEGGEESAPQEQSPSQSEKADDTDDCRLESTQEPMRRSVADR